MRVVHCSLLIAILVAIAGCTADAPTPATTSVSVATDARDAAEQERLAALEAERLAAQEAERLAELEAALRRKVRDEHLAAVAKLGGKAKLGDSGPDAVIIAIDLAGCPVGDEQLASLPSADLRELDLRGTDVSDEGLLNLLEFQDLEVLCLAATKVSDAGLESLAKLPWLRQLDLSGTQLTGVHLEKLAACTELEELRLADTDIGDAELTQLKQLSGLRTLDLNGTKVSDTAAGTLGSMATITKLDLGRTALTAAGLAELARAPQLRELFLIDCQIPADGWSALTAAGKLRWLNADGRQFAAAGLARLAAPPAEDQDLPRLVELFGNREALAVLANPHKVEAYRIRQKQLLAGPVLVAQPEARALLAALLSSPRSYWWEGEKRCAHEPALHFRFLKGLAEVNFDLCFSCDMLGVIEEQGADALTASAARIEDIDPVRDDLLAIVQRLFPDDEELSAVEPNGLLNRALAPLANELEQYLVAGGEDAVVIGPIDGPPQSAAGDRVAQALRQLLSGRLRVVDRDAPLLLGTCAGGFDEESGKFVLALSAQLRDRQGIELLTLAPQSVAGDLDLLESWEAWPPLD